MLYCVSTSSFVTTDSSFNCSLGVMPAMSGFVYLACTISFRDATRIMKNSSRLDAVILKNFSLSNRGRLLSLASERTLSLNLIQLSSLFQ